MTNPFVQKPTHYISPDDVKVLKEALEYHVKQSEEYEEQSILEINYGDRSTCNELAQKHTRIAEALRRVAG